MSSLSSLSLSSLSLTTIIIIILSCYLENIHGLSILMEGWLRQPHSFAIVNSFQILGIMSSYQDVVIYYLETPFYYGQKSNTSDLLALFGDSYQKILRHGIRKWNNEHIDVIYRIHFPLDLRNDAVEDMKCPLILFYAATRSVYTYSELHVQSMIDWPAQQRADLFDVRHNIEVARSDVMALPSNVYFVTPSPGSAHAMKNLMQYQHYQSNHRIIPHGVDLSIFYHEFDNKIRDQTRLKYDIQAKDILFLHIGAMVSTKGIDNMILLMHNLAVNSHIGSFKLILKGLESVYESEALLRSRFDVIADQSVISREILEDILANNIKFTGATLTFSEMNDLLNAADAYLAPYVSEAFNMPLLEAIATGVPVFVSTNGSTGYFVDHILEQVPGAELRLFKLPSELYDFHEFNYFECRHTILFYAVLTKLPLLKRQLSKYYYYSLQAFLFEHYSWNAVARQLINMIDEVLWVEDRKNLRLS